MLSYLAVALIATALGVILGGHSSANSTSNRIGALHRREAFFISGPYVTVNETNQFQDGPMFVEHLIPEDVTAKFPIVMIHGLAQTGANFLTKPDGSLGWADHFLSLGYELYIVDQPNRGRSAWVPDLDGPLQKLTAERTSQMFTAIKRFALWPRASKHTQWPGNGSVGDPIFDNFFAQQVQSLFSGLETDEKMLVVGSQLLDRIGESILLAHSQGGKLGWILADARPSLVKGIITIEPSGPPFINAVFSPFNRTREYGLTDISLHYDPPITSASELNPTVVSSKPNVTCFAQGEPAHKLVNLLDIPILYITSDSGYNSEYDNCTVAYLRQAGITKMDHVRLEDVGIHGNGHMMFMEKNSDTILEEVLVPWLSSHFEKI